MRGKAATVVLAAGIVSLAGCATTHEHSTATTWGELTPSEQRVVSINREARRRGVGVVWINPPTRGERKATTDEPDNG